MSTVVNLLTGNPLLPAEMAGEPMPKCLTAHLEYLRQRGLSESTAYKRLRALVRFREWIGHDLFAVTPEEVGEWRSSLIDRYAPETQANEIYHVKDFYEWAAITGKMRRNPAIGLRYPRLGRRLPRPIADDKLFQALTGAPQPIRAMLVLGGYAGLRCKEIALLRRENVMENARPPALLIARNATKGYSERIVPMSDFLVAELLPVLPAGGWVFRRADGRAGSNQPWRISHICNTYLHELGIAETFHQFRHWFGTNAYQVSRDLRAVQELMGHQYPTSTAGYTLYDNAAAVAAVQALPAPGRLKVVGKRARG